jgi:hypothetical protein
MMMGLSWGEVLLLVLSGWTAVGALGIAVSWSRGERGKARRDLGWIAAIWLLYLAALVTLSLTARPREVAIGQEQCFHQMCFAVMRAEVMPGYLAQNGEQLIRVGVLVTNRSIGKTRRDHRLRAYLVDAHGQRWRDIPGLEGVRLTATVPPQTSVTSEPVFKVAGDANGLALVFTHGIGLPEALVIGDRDSLFHPLVTVPLMTDKSKSIRQFR